MSTARKSAAAATSATTTARRRSPLAFARLARAVMPVLRQLGAGRAAGRTAAATRNDRPTMRSEIETLEVRAMLSGNFPAASDNAIAYDASGNLHVAYYDAAAHNLKYVRQSPGGLFTDPIT